MKKRIYFFILLFVSSFCIAQNLVPNGNFEQHSGCPSGLNQLYHATYWINPTGWTPDYYHMCGFGNAGVPDNAGGFQNALSDSAYADIFLYSSVPDGREFIETPLTSPLIAGSCYEFTMYINLLNNSEYTTRNIGVLFSDTLINIAPSLGIIPLTPQLVNSNPAYPDTLNWYQVTGNYIATGGESYMVIGNFDNDANTQFVQVNPSGFDYAIVYIDDVSLTPCNPNSIEESGNEILAVYPNPFSDQLTLSFAPDAELTVELYDICSHRISQSDFVGTTTLVTESLARGIYFYEVKVKNGPDNSRVIKKGKIVKN